MRGRRPATTRSAPPGRPADKDQRSQIMTMTETTAATPSLFPAVTGRLVPTILLAGIAADLTWEVWARGITPFLVGGPLEPAALVQSVFGFQSWVAGELIHAIVG